MNSNGSNGHNGTRVGADAGGCADPDCTMSPAEHTALRAGVADRMRRAALHAYVAIDDVPFSEQEQQEYGVHGDGTPHESGLTPEGIEYGNSLVAEFAMMVIDEADPSPASAPVNFPGVIRDRAADGTVAADGSVTLRIPSGPFVMVQMRTPDDTGAEFGVVTLATSPHVRYARNVDVPAEVTGNEAVSMEALLDLGLTAVRGYGEQRPGEPFPQDGPHAGPVSAETVEVVRGLFARAFAADVDVAPPAVAAAHIADLLAHGGEGGSWRRSPDVEPVADMPVGIFGESDAPATPQCDTGRASPSAPAAGGASPSTASEGSGSSGATSDGTAGE